MALQKLINEKIRQFEEELAHFVQDFDSKNRQLQTQLSLTHEQRDETIQKADSDYQIEHAGLKKQCEYLKAEVWRYKKLLEDYHKSSSSPEMNKRIHELETAINEHTDLKIKNHGEKYEKERALLLHDFQKRVHDLQVKIEILEEEIRDKVSLHHTSFREGLDSVTEQNKGTAKVTGLVQFEPGTYDQTNASVRVGEFSKTLSAGIGELNIEYPVILDFQDVQNLVIIYDEASLSKAENITDVLLFRILSSNLPDKLKIHIQDTQYFEKFREFLNLPSSILSKGSELEQLLIEIKKLETEIRDKITLVWSDIHDTHQSIHEYNQKKIKAESYDQIIPYRLFVADHFESLLQKNEISQLFSRLSNLTRYGTNFVFLLQAPLSEEKEFSELLAKIPEKAFEFLDLTGKYKPSAYSKSAFNSLNLNNDDKKMILTRFLQELAELEKNRNKLKYTQFYEQDSNKWFLERAGGQLKLPIGRSLKRNGLEYLYFKTKEGLSNALLCGGVGSGKTNFLKTIITSVALNYSPEEVELYLIDMKNGAGFSVFQTQRLPHVSLFAFSAENELIHDVFHNLKIEMDKRYADYAKFNIDNLEDVYNDPNLAPLAPKRILVIIDEFASIYTSSDLYLDEISSNILNIVQRGRAMGINLLLATQNFDSIKHSAFSQAVTQIPTRILLKSSPEAAMSILGMSNNGYKEVTRIGEGFVNYNFGEINSDGGNLFFKSFLLDNEDLIPILNHIRSAVEDRRFRMPNQVSIDSAMPAVFSKNLAIKNYLQQQDVADIYRKQGIPCWMGESFLIKEENHFSFHWKINNKSYNQNILFSGNERDFSYQSLYSIISSISYAIPNGRFSIKLVNPLDDELNKEIGLSQVIGKLPLSLYELFGEKDLQFVFDSLEKMMEVRKNGKEEKDPIVVVLPAMEKFILLHGDTYNNPYADRLKQLLSSGSSYGIYFICEINKPSNLNKINRDLIGCFEHRISFHLNAEESDFIVNSKIASQLINPEIPTIRTNAIYYSQSNQSWSKFKSYLNLQNEQDLIRPGIENHSSFLKFSNYQTSESASETISKQDNVIHGINLDQLGDVKIPLDLFIGLGGNENQ
jgi:S-DNA-T family DNA segregation ATPase FtsK/SpoIIIE